MSALASRLVQAVIVAVLIGTATFAMMRSLPGDAAWRIAAGRYGYDRVDAAAADAVREELGLDGPVLPALLQWLGDLARLGFGNSLVTGQPVIGEIAHQLGASVSLAVVAILVSLLIGPPLGIVAGLRPGGVLDRVLLVASTGLKAVPQFLMALVLIVLLAVQLRWLPAAGHGEARHFVLPSLTLALGLAPVNARIARDAMARIADMPFWRFAQWKGLSQRQTLIRHGLRNVSVPLITYLGLQFVTLVEGVIIVESIFGWPGIGHALVHAIFSRDVPMVQGTALVLGLGFVVVNAGIDLAVRRLESEGCSMSVFETYNERHPSLPLARLTGGALIMLVGLFAVMGPLIVSGDPFAQSLTKALAGPESAAPLGYDHLGRSVFHRLAQALRLSPLIALAAVATAGAAGLLLGTLAAARGGWIDRVLVMLADALLALPGLLLVLIVLAMVPGTALGFWAGLSLVLWVEFFRLTRAATRETLASPAVQASRLLGFGPAYLFRVHVWPEIAPMMLTAAAFGTATAIMAIAALGFVHVGMRAPTPELGLMMVELLPYWREAPLALLSPVISTFALLLGLTLLAGSRET